MSDAKDTKDDWDISELEDYMHNLSNIINYLIEEHLRVCPPPEKLNLTLADIEISTSMIPKSSTNTYEAHQNNMSYQQVKDSVFEITEWFNFFTTIFEADDIETIYGSIGFDSSLDMSDYTNLEKVEDTDKRTIFEMFNYLDPMDVDERRYGLMSDMFNYSDFKVVVDADYSRPHKNCICFDMFPQEDCSNNILIIYRYDTGDVFVNTEGYLDLNANDIIKSFF